MPLSYPVAGLCLPAAVRRLLYAALAAAGPACAPAAAQSLSPLLATPLGMPPLPVAPVRPAHVAAPRARQTQAPTPQNAAAQMAVAQSPLRAVPWPGGATPGQQCRRAIKAAERAAQIPDQLMAAIARVESGRREADGTVNPWPWSINVAGEDHIFDTKAEAVAAVRTLQAQGVRSIDVGCMQVNLMFHPDAFATLEQAFDPVANADYAARFLVQLHEQTGTWPTATAWYHSATPELGEDYRRKVMAVWPEEKRQPPQDTTRADLVAAWAATRGGASGTGAALGLGSAVGNRASMAHLLPLPSGAAPGHGLAAYRAMPIPLAARPLLPLNAGGLTSHG